FKWAQPTFKLDHLIATQFQRFERTVSRHWSPQDNTLTEHIFEILDWGGELIGEAQGALLKVERIHAIVIVVDVGEDDPGGGAQVASPARVRYQLEQFNPHVLRLFFSRNIVSHCKTYVLFINKADLLSGTWLEVEQQVRRLYQPLIDVLMTYQGRDGI